MYTTLPIWMDCAPDASLLGNSGAMVPDLPAFTLTASVMPCAADELRVGAPVHAVLVPLSTGYGVPTSKYDPVKAWSFAPSTLSGRGSVNWPSAARSAVVSASVVAALPLPTVISP